MLQQLTRAKSASMLILAFTLSVQSFTPKKNKMKIQTQQQAPDFTAKDVNGVKLSLSDYKGKKVLLLFNRNVGCPICNLQYHQLSENAAYFKQKGVAVLSVYESSVENMKTYLQDETPFQTMIPDPALSLYQLYGIERRGTKILKGIFKGALNKAKKGNKLFKKKMKQDGNADRINAGFLMDEEGKVMVAYYGKYLGDHLSIPGIKDLLDKQ